MFSKALLIFSLSLSHVAFATVYITAPVASTVYQAGQSALVSWIPDNNAPTLDQFGLASVSIYAGNANQQTQLQLLSPSIDVSKSSSLNFTPKADIGPDGQEYFIRIESLGFKDKSGNFVESFSALFTLTGMSGQFSPSVIAEISGQSTAPLAGQSTPAVSGATSSSSTPSLTGSHASKTASGASSTTSATAKPSSGAMGLKAKWVGILFGAVVGVTMF